MVSVVSFKFPVLLVICIYFWLFFYLYIEFPLEFLIAKHENETGKTDLFFRLSMLYNLLLLEAITVYFFSDKFCIIFYATKKNGFPGTKPGKYKPAISDIPSLCLR